VLFVSAESDESFCAQRISASVGVSYPPTNQPTNLPTYLTIHPSIHNEVFALLPLSVSQNKYKDLFPLPTTQHHKYTLWYSTSSYWTLHQAIDIITTVVRSCYVL